MSLSVDKLNRLLRNSGILPKKYFTIEGACVYIETLVLETADVLLVYIPSKYEIVAPNTGNIFELTQIDVNSDGTIAGDYGGAEDENRTQEYYEQVDMGINSLNGKNNTVEKELQSYYDRPVTLKDVNQKDMSNIRDTFRQLRRLKLCVETLKYKLCVSFKNYLCCIRRDNLFDGFAIQGPRSANTNRLLVSIDLESLYSKLKNISMDVRLVREGVYKVLDQNHRRHVTNFQKILERRASLVQSSKLSSARKLKYASYLSRLDKMLNTLDEAERKESDSIIAVNQKYITESSVKGLHQDIAKSHELSKHSKKITEINTVRQDVIAKSLEVKAVLEDLSLRMDRVCFDNIVMLDAMLRNFVSMSDF